MCCSHVKLALPLVVMLFLSFGACAAAPPAPSRPPPRSILIVPFRVSGDDRLAWIGEALARDLLAEASSLGTKTTIIALPRSRPNASAPAPTSAPAAAVAPTLAQTARDAGAEVALGGDVQVVGEELRISAELVAADGKPRGALKATGPLRELFRLEDELSAQLAARLGGDSLAQPTPATTPLPQPSQPYTTSAPYTSAPYTYAPYTYSSYTYAPSSGYYSSYPYYRSPYSSYYFYSGLGTYSHSGFRHVDAVRPHVSLDVHRNDRPQVFRGGHIGGQVSGHVSGGHVSGGGHVSVGGHAGSGGHGGGGHH